MHVNDETEADDAIRRSICCFSFDFAALDCSLAYNRFGLVPHSVAKTHSQATTQSIIQYGMPNRTLSSTALLTPRRALQSGDAPTDKQAGFLASLAKQTGERVTVEGMDRAEASSKIEDLLEKKDGGQTGAGAVVDRSEELKDDVSYFVKGCCPVSDESREAFPRG